MSPSLYPLDAALFLRKRRQNLRMLSERGGLQPIRIAILGGVTTQEIAASLEVLLLERGVRAVLWQSEFQRFYEDAVLDPAALIAFQPDIVYVCTSSKNVRPFPAPLAGEEAVAGWLSEEHGKLRRVWMALRKNLPACTILQNNFEPVATRLFGNLECVAPYAPGELLRELNRQLAGEARQDPALLIVDAAGVAAQLGMDRWYSERDWFSYKTAQTPTGAVYLANAVAALVGAILGRTKKCLVLDLDNTLWGGVVGDDGVERLQIGRETPVGEGYTAFQEYCLRLKRRGVLLAVCSKNDEVNARAGFGHPDSVLKESDFASFQANWGPKPDSIETIARELNIGLDSLVFVDDNPAERALVRGRLPMVAVPEVGDDVSLFARTIDEAGYFETVALSREDIERTALYQENSERQSLERSFEDYGEYLASLEMEAEVGAFSPVYLDRIAQLTNKTNQFNLTTKRYSRAELEAIAGQPGSVTLYGRLKDRFGDNGLVTVLMGFVRGDCLEIDLWLMSCRVLKRDMELLMLDELARRAAGAGASRLVGRYIRTAKNGMVADHFEKLGFRRLSGSEEESTWELEIGEGRYEARNRHIKEIRADGGSAGTRKATAHFS